MHWLNIEITKTEGPEYTSAEPAQQLAWFHLLLYCAKQENGGIIAGASGFSDRQWSRMIDVDWQTIRSACALWDWDSEGNLVVWNYPVEQERVVRAKREGGRKGGILKGASRSPSRSPSGNASRSPSTKEELELEQEVESELEQESVSGTESFALMPADADTKRETISATPRKCSKPKEPADPRHAEIMRALIETRRKATGIHAPLSAPAAIGQALRSYLRHDERPADAILSDYATACRESLSDAARFDGALRRASDPLWFLTRTGEIMTAIARANGAGHAVRGEEW